MLTTLIALGALLFTGVSVMQTGRQNTQQNNLAEQGQITDRYTAAVDQIGSPSMDVRLGGIYALERIMRDSRADQSTIVDVLSAFVRNHPPGGTPPELKGWPWGTPIVRLVGSIRLPADVAAALAVLGRRNAAYDGSSTEDLHDVNFAEVDLSSLSFVNADMSHTKLMLTNLWLADMNGARLSDADISSSELDYTSLKNADLSNATLNYDDLDGAILNGANLTDAQMIDAQMGGAHMTHTELNSANLTCADLDGQDLTSTDVGFADLTCTNLTGANLSGVELFDNIVNARLTNANMTNTWLCSGSQLVKPALHYECLGR